MTVLDDLEGLEREWGTSALITLASNHLPALIEIARAAEHFVACVDLDDHADPQTSGTAAYLVKRRSARLRHALARLEGEK